MSVVNPRSWFARSSRFDESDLDYFDAIENEPNLPRVTLIVGGRAKADPTKSYLNSADLSDANALPPDAREVIAAFRTSS